MTAFLSISYQYTLEKDDNEPSFGSFRPGFLQSALLKIVSIPPFYRGIFRRPMANLIRALGKQGIVDIERNNASYRLRGPANLIEDAVLVHSNYNIREINFLRDGTPEGGTFLDLGANMGLYTLAIAHKAGPKGRVLAIDANPKIVKALAFNAQASKLQNVTIACIAVGEKHKKVRLEMRKDDHAIVETHEDPDGDVDMLPLHDIIHAFGITQIATLKADIEGYEDRALIPFLKDATPALTPQRIVIEHAAHYDWKEDLSAFLVGFGYILIAKERSNSLYELNKAQNT